MIFYKNKIDQVETRLKCVELAIALGKEEKQDVETILWFAKEIERYVLLPFPTVSMPKFPITKPKPRK